MILSPPPATLRRRRVARVSFYPAMAVVILAVVVVGFGPGFGPRLLHAASPPPLILHVHAAVFGGWVLLFLLQTLLIRNGSLSWHRRLGTAALTFGVLLPFLGIQTALTMTRLRHGGGEAFLALSCFDMLAFTVLFWLAVYWRRRPAFHRRLMYMATCGLTVAAFARFPGWLMPGRFWYAAVDLLILIAMLRDWHVEKTIHPVYRYGLPLLVLGQAAAMVMWLTAWPAWVTVAHWLLG